MRKSINYQGHKICYTIVGKGNPVLFIHGFGETGTVWKNQIDFFSNELEMIIPDLPGSGDSEMIDDMSMEGMAEVMRAILQEEKKEALPVIGHSMGGYIVLAFAEKYPASLTGLGLFHSTAFADSEEKKDTRRKGIAFIEQHGAFEFLKTTSPNLFSPATKSENSGLIEEFISGLNNFSPLSLVSYYNAMMMRPDRTEVLRNAGYPVLFIMGKYDTAVPLADNLKLCSLPENSYIEILKNSGHMGMLEEPVLSNYALANFLT